MKENKIKLCSGKAAGNAGSVDYEQDYLSNKEIDMECKFKPFDLEAAKAGAPRDDARRSSGEDSRVRPESRR